MKLKELGTIVTGNTPSKQSVENWDSPDIGFVKPDIISDTGISIIDDAAEYISEKARAKARIVGENSILITCIGSIGKIGITAKGTFAFNQQINAIIPNRKVNSKYLAYALLYAKPRLVAIANAPVVPIINKSQFGDFEIKVTENTEYQSKAVEVLDTVNAIIENRRQQLQKLDELVKARFVEMFGDPVTNPMDWPTKPLLEMGYCKNGMNFHTGDSGIEMHCLGVGDFKDYSVIDGTDYLPTISLNEAPPEESMLQDGDLVFVRSNGNKALVGRCLLVYPHNTPTTYSGFCIRYRLTSAEVNIAYLLRVLKTDSMRKKMAGRGANIQNLNQQILAALNIPTPPLELQEWFTAFIEQIDKSKVAVQKSLDEAQLLFDSLMQQYFG